MPFWTEVRASTVSFLFSRLPVPASSCAAPRQVLKTKWKTLKSQNENIGTHTLIARTRFGTQNRFAGTVTRPKKEKWSDPLPCVKRTKSFFHRDKSGRSFRTVMLLISTSEKVVLSNLQALCASKPTSDTIVVSNEGLLYCKSLIRFELIS